MHDFSQRINVFQGDYMPEPEMKLAGYGAIVHTYKLRVPTSLRVSVISNHNRNYQKDKWNIYGTRYSPDNSLIAHLTFALKYEGVNLTVLKALFKIIDANDIITIISNEPTSGYARRIWFLYEWLMEKCLPLPDSPPIGLVNVVDEKLQYAGPARVAKRYRVRNNLPGVTGFCPLVHRTKKIDDFIESHADENLKHITEQIHPDILARAAAFLLLQDSKASYAIEGEHPPRNRLERWGKAIGQAGINTLTHDELLRLQEIVINDFRFVHFGYRVEGGFIGQHDRYSHLPIPDHISAKWQDIYELMDNLFATNNLLRNTDYPFILTATIIAFGFVFIHPFEDGNGRIHRYLINHVLAENGFIPSGFAFPISAVILKHIDKYKDVLETYSRNVLPFIEWRTTDKNNVEVLNDTKDLYTYFDATPQAEFLVDCAKETIEKTLPEEITYMQNHAQMREFIINYIDMSNTNIELMINFLNQGKGKFSKRALAKEFIALTAEEVEVLENKYQQIFHEKEN